MPDEQVKRKRGRPRKNPVAETNTTSSPTVINNQGHSTGKNGNNEIFEYNSYSTTDIFAPLFACGVYDYFNKDEIKCVLKNPILNHSTAIRLSEFVYTKNAELSS